MALGFAVLKVHSAYVELENACVLCYQSVALSVQKNVGTKEQVTNLGFQVREHLEVHASPLRSHKALL